MARGSDAATDPRTTDDMVRDIEATRTHLASTIDQLTYRARPKTIVMRKAAETKAHFVAADGSVRLGNITKVAGAAAGAIAVIVGIRMLVGRG